MRLKTISTLALLTVLSPAVPALATQVNTLTCPTRLVLGEGTKALRAAPVELRTKIWDNFEAVFRAPLVGSVSDSFEVLYALDGDSQRVRALASAVIQRYVYTSPLRENAPLLGNGSSLPSLPQPPSNLLGGEKNGPQPFVSKYGLRDYKEFSERVLHDILPPEFSKTSRMTARYSYGFTTYAGTELFRVAHQLNLEHEQALLKMLFLIHEDYESLGNALEIAENDGGMYEAGLNALSDFYLADLYRFHGNKLWNVIELMKRVKDPHVRDKVRAVFIDLAEDLMSDERKNELGNASDQDTWLGYLLRGLTSIGEEILCIEPADSVKFDYITRSTDPKLRAAIRAVASAQRGFNGPGRVMEWFKAYLVTGDLEAIEQLLESVQGEDVPFVKVRMLITLNRIEEAVAEFRLRFADEKTWISDHWFRTFARDLPLIPHAYHFRQGLDIGHLVALQRQEKGLVGRRISVGDRMRHTNYPDASYLHKRSSDVEQSMNRARAHEARGDSHNAGIQFMEAAFYLYRDRPALP